MKTRALFLLAFRSVGRNVRRSALTATAMALGLALLIFFRGIAEGVHEQWIDSAVRLSTGHVAVQAPGYLEAGRLDQRLDSARVARVVGSLRDPAVAPMVKAWAERLSVSGLASSAASALPVEIHGVDPDRERRFSALLGQLKQGDFLEPGDRLKAYVGAGLARRLQLEVGSRFVLTAQTAGGDVEGQLVRVAGIFETGIEEMDQGVIDVPIETVRDWLGAPGAATTVAVLLGSSHETDVATRRIRAALGDTQGIRVLSWREASPEMDSAVRIDDYGDYLFHIVLFAIIALAILNAILMSVLGRRREFGLLQALGLTGAQTGIVVLGEGLFLTAASGIAGMVLGFAFTWGFFRNGLDLSAFVQGMTASGGIVDPVAVPVFRYDQILVSLVSIAVIGILASLYPALRASKLDVAEAMTFER